MAQLLTVASILAVIEPSAQAGVGLWLSLLLMVGLLGLSAAFSGSEAILFSLTAIELQQCAASAHPLRRTAAALMAHPKRTLALILLGNMAVNVLLFAVSYGTFQRLAMQYGAWLTPLTGVLSVGMVIIAGEVVPKVLGATLAMRLAPGAAAILRVTGWVFGPISRVLDLVVIEPLTRLISGRPSNATTGTPDLSTVELKALLEMSRQHGVINPVEDAFLREVIDLSFVRVQDVMVPRVEMLSYDVRGDPAELLDLMRRTSRKKIPVYDGDIDNIVGLIYAKILAFNPGKPLRELVQPVRFVPALITCEQLLQHFRQTRTQMAIAVDEFGGVAGLVTLEDVIEQIVGDIPAPDEQAAGPELVQVSPTEYEVSGRLSLHYWTQAFGRSELAGRIATVGGLVTALLGRAARVGDRARLRNVEFEVLRVQRRRVERLRVRLLETTDESGDSGPRNGRNGARAGGAGGVA